MQAIRLMDMPDRVIAFDSLPEEMLNGLEMIPADGFPRSWKEWLGKRKRTIRVPLERDPITNQVVRMPPLHEEDYYFYLVDWTIGQQVEKWRAIESYVKRHAPLGVNIPDKLEDMAIPLAKDKISGIEMEPEDVPLIKLNQALIQPEAERIKVYVCTECSKEFKNEHGLNVHKSSKHKPAITMPHVTPEPETKQPEIKEPVSVSGE